MRKIHLTKAEWIKRLLVVLVVTIVIAMAGIYAGSRGLNQTAGDLVASIQKGADISMDSIQHRAVRDGVEQWRLDAASAHYMQKKKEAVFDKVALTFFQDGGGEIRLKADRGVLDTDTNDMEVSGNVVMAADTYQLETEELQYDHQRRKISADHAVRIHREESTLTSDSMQFLMDEDRLILEGRVHGIFEQHQLL
jgi:LPS export ABC transporter protein LptC